MVIAGYGIGGAENFVVLIDGTAEVGYWLKWASDGVIGGGVAGGGHVGDI